MKWCTALCMLMLLCSPAYAEDSTLNYRSGSAGDRVANGIEVDGTIRRVPFILLIRPKDGANVPMVRCGAAIVDPIVTDEGVVWRSGEVTMPKWAITAAHCLTDFLNRPVDPSLLFVTGGQLGLDPSEGIVADVKEIIFHPRGFRREDGENDIALMVLDNVLLNADRLSMRSIKLDHTQGALVAPYTSLFVAGWGKDALNERPEVLFEAQLPAVDRQSCRDALAAASTLDQAVYDLKDTMFCAGFGSGGYDACMGDSGGPLFYRPPLTGRGRWGEPLLAGIVSWSPRACNRVGQFGIYTHVESYTGWLDEAVTIHLEQ